ncbi:uncharacterized protein FOMMEDRAFT_151119 [Fomitiporia mediterranea MF3/22]|uniref:uncharacterized protein n=1 Tax=Fomitiporia mediterranea (strain MF3/22) TaxID=694068 RepID=UPI0004409B82|nr:uncharacterized protein FOMMEDRAFT_151119 [Fomitiporia mediterranea MF3/22]EJD08340.1 hypothetical protein FOMMEDRAFT_151119 [Fomitiporia mediterranea MF3/22]
MSKAPRKTSRASGSRKDGETIQEIQFYRETGQTYRPFTDPKRIETNDQKKATKGDARAHVRGVPDEYLSVMSTTDSIETSQSTPDSASLVQTDTAMTEVQCHEETLNTSESSLQQTYPIGFNEPLYSPVQYGNSDVAVAVPELHVDIPSRMLCQAGDYQMHLLTSTSPDGSTSHSAYQESFDHPPPLPFSYGVQPMYHNELMNCSSYTNDFDGRMLADVQLSSGAPSDSGSSDDSCEIDQILDNFEQWRTPVEPLEEYHCSLHIAPSPTSQSPSSQCDGEQPYFGPQGPFLSGPDVISQTFSVLSAHMDTGCVSDQVYADALQNRQKMVFGHAGLDYLNTGHDSNSGDTQQGMDAYTHEAMDFNLHQSHCGEFITI